MENSLNILSTRTGFNAALKHFKIVNGFIDGVKKSQNLADLLNKAINCGHIKQYQLRSILNALLIDKFSYHSKSFNMKTTNIDSLESVSNEISTWNLFDIIFTYFHPQLGQLVIDPKKKENLTSIEGGLKEFEFAVVYIGNYTNSFDSELAKKASDAFVDLINGKKLKDEETKIFKTYQKPTQPKTTVETKKTESNNAVKPSVQDSKNVKLSPKYGIVVQNELFHNGNVEAWKKIITSYETTYPNLKVLVFYDNEHIKDLNTLFKWGKVKFGTFILFSILGTEFTDISKLRRYLAQGASPRFEDFLKGPPNQVLSLF